MVKALLAIILAIALVACQTQTGAVTMPEPRDTVPAEQIAPAETTAPISTETIPTQSPTENVIDVNMRMGNWFVEPREIRAKQGDLVRVNLQVESGTHGLGIQGYNVNSGPLGPGESKTVEFTADQPGTFMFFCNVPCGTGHRDMRGQLVVE